MNNVQSDSVGLAETSASSVRAQFDPTARVAEAKGPVHLRLKAEVEAWSARHRTLSQQIVLSGPLRAFALLTDLSFDYSGQGDASYWQRAAENMVEGAHALAFALSGFAGAVAEGLFEEALRGQAERLYELETFGKGDAAYWAGFTRDLREEIRSVGEILNDLSEGADCERVSVAAPLNAFADFLSGFEVNPRGSLQAAMRTSRDVTVLAHGVSAAVEALASAAKRPQRGVVLALARTLRQLDAEGSGAGDFWLARTKELGASVRAVGAALHVATESLGAPSSIN